MNIHTSDTLEESPPLISVDKKVSYGELIVTWEDKQEENRGPPKETVANPWLTVANPGLTVENRSQTMA